MVNYKFINTISAIASVIVYLFFLFFVVYIYKDDLYNLKKENFDPSSAVVIDLKDISVKEKEVKKESKKTVSKKLIKISQNSKKETKKDSRDKEQSDIKNLFSTMRVDKNDNEVEEKLKKEKKRASRLKKINADELFKSKKLDNSELEKELKDIKKSIKQDNNSKLTKEQLRYASSIGSMIQAKWQNTIGTKDGLKSIVIIKIDKNGHLFYRILTKSFNNSFDTKLKQFLDNLKNQKFPVFKKGRSFEFKYVFKDEEEF